eukprot:3624731-Alexandrium_andersonii.AAC.1
MRRLRGGATACPGRRWPPSNVRASPAARRSCRSDCRRRRQRGGAAEQRRRRRTASKAKACTGARR